MFGSNKPPKQPLDVDAANGQDNINLDRLLEECKASIATANQAVTTNRQAMAEFKASYQTQLAAARFRFAAGNNQGLKNNAATEQKGNTSVPAKKTPTIR